MKQSQPSCKQEIAVPIGLDTGYAYLTSGARNDILLEGQSTCQRTKALGG